MSSRRGRMSIAVFGAVGFLLVVLVLTGAFAARPPEPTPGIALAHSVLTSRADVSVDSIAYLDDGEVGVTLTVTNLLPVPMRITDLIVVADDHGDIARFGTARVGEVLAQSAQPGVTDTFTVAYELEREPVGALRVEIIDATWTPRDDTAFHLGDLMMHRRVVGTVTAR